MAKFKSGHQGRRNLGNKKNGVKVGGAKPVLALPAFIDDQPESPPIFKLDKSFNYAIMVDDATTPDKNLNQILTELSDSPVVTQIKTSTSDKFANPAETTPGEDTPSPGGGASGNAKKPKVIYQSEGAAIWRDSIGRIHAVYSEMMTDKIDGPTFFVRLQTKDNNIEEIDVEIVADDVNATPEKPVRVLMYNRNEDIDNQSIIFDQNNARPMVWLHSQISDKKFKSKMVTHALLPEKVSWERSEEVDLVYWINEFCDCDGDESIEGDPQKPVITPGPEQFVNDGGGSEPSPTASDEIILVGAGGLDGTKTVSDRDTSETITEDTQAPPTACQSTGSSTTTTPGGASNSNGREDEPFTPLPSIGHPSYERTERHRLCQRKLKHIHGIEVRVISGMPWGGMFLFYEPTTIAQFDDGPLSNIEPELRVSENTDSLHENASTRIFDDDGNEADFDDLTAAQQPEFYTDGEDTDPYRWMLRMMCPPDARGGFIHDPDANRTGLLRDLVTLNVPGHLELKTGSFFRVLGPTDCNHDTHTKTGPIDFRLQEGEFGCFPCGDTKQPDTETAPPSAPGGVSKQRAEGQDFKFVGPSSDHAASVYSFPGGNIPQSSNVSTVGSVSFSPDTPFNARRLLQEWFREHNIRVDLSGVRLQLFQQDGSGGIRFSTQQELIAQLETNLPEAVKSGLNWTIV